jgi:hypothetical protein
LTTRAKAATARSMRLTATPVLIAAGRLMSPPDVLAA